MTKSKKNLWFPFFPSDWTGEKGLRACSLAARGLWIEMMCFMHDATPYGHLTLGGKRITPERLARMVGATETEVTGLLLELQESGVYDVAEDGTIYSRRMVRDAAKRSTAKINGATGGNPALKDRYNEAGYVYVARRESDGATKIGASRDPEKRISGLRADHGEMTLLETFRVEDMGNAEAALHTKFSFKKITGEWFRLDEPDFPVLREIIKKSSSPVNRIKAEGFDSRKNGPLDLDLDLDLGFSGNSGEEEASHAREPEPDPLEVELEMAAERWNEIAARPGLTLPRTRFSGKQADAIRRKYAEMRQEHDETILKRALEQVPKANKALGEGWFDFHFMFQRSDGVRWNAEKLANGYYAGRKVAAAPETKSAAKSRFERFGD